VPVCIPGSRSTSPKMLTSLAVRPECSDDRGEGLTNLEDLLEIAGQRRTAEGRRLELVELASSRARTDSNVVASASRTMNNTSGPSFWSPHEDARSGAGFR